MKRSLQTAAFIGVCGLLLAGPSSLGAQSGKSGTGKGEQNSLSSMPAASPAPSAAPAAGTKASAPATSQAAPSPTAAVSSPSDAPERSSYAALDAKVRALPAVRSIGELAGRIRPLAKSEWEAARAVYIWVTNNIDYDADAFFYGRSISTDPETAFAARKSVCDGYSNIAVELMNGLGLEARKISGWAKGYGYSGGQSFSRTNHAWVAVKLSGKWRLMDPTWGAGHVEGRKFVRKYAEFWFDTDPEVFVLTHLPEKAADQLVKKPMTMAEYVAMPYVPTYDCERFWEGGWPSDSFAARARAGKPFPDAFSFLGLAKLGFSGAELAALIESGQEIAESWDLEKLDMRIVEGSPAKVIPALKPMKLSARASGVRKAAVITASGEWLWLKAGADGLLSLEFTPIRGQTKLVVDYEASGDPGSYYTLIEWSAR